MILNKLTFFLNGASLMLFLIALTHIGVCAFKRQSRAHWFFAVCLAWMVLIEVKEVVLNSLYPAYNFEVLGPWFTLPDLFTLPIVSFFFFELVMPGRMTLRYTLKLLAPFILLGSCCIVAASLGERPVYNDLGELFGALPDAYPLLMILYVVYAIGYSIFASGRVVTYSLRYADQIAQCYSFTERIHIRWMRWMAAIMAFYLISYIFIISLATSDISTLFTFVITLAAWGALYGCVVQYQIPRIIKGYWQTPETEPKASEPRNGEPSRTEQLKMQVDIAIHERKLFLNPALTIVDMALECGTNRTHLSQFFNNDLGMSFRDYINHCRVEHAIHLMQTESYKIEELAILSGFGSTTTFYRAFAKEKGTTPQGWYEQHRNDGTTKLQTSR